MIAHTPGPWMANVHVDRDSVRISADGRQVALVSADTVTISGTEVVSTQAKSDARLIAAAPDLLASLERAINDENNPLHVATCVSNPILRPCCWVTQARAAIAKARGER